MKKVCTKCQKEKKIEDFWLNKKHKDGRYQHCKECGRKKANEWRKKVTIKEYKPGTPIEWEKIKGY